MYVIPWGIDVPEETHPYAMHTIMFSAILISWCVLHAKRFSACRAGIRKINTIWIFDVWNIRIFQYLCVLLWIVFYKPITFGLIRPPDIPVGELIFYHGFFFLSSFFFSFRPLISELAERNSTKLGQTHRQTGWSQYCAPLSGRSNYKQSQSK